MIYFMFYLEWPLFVLVSSDDDCYFTVKKNRSPEPVGLIIMRVTQFNFIHSL